MSYRDKFKERYANDPEFRAQHIARTISSQNKRREKYVEWKNGFSCSRCGDTRSYVIDFHHRTRRPRKGRWLICSSVGERVSSRSFRTLWRFAPTATGNSTT